MKPAVDFRARVAELKALGSARPRRQDREIVMAALGCKWEGLQSVAAQILGRWGDRESVAALRDLWMECQKRKHGCAIEGVIARALSECVGEPDAQWVLDLYFEDAANLERHYLRGVVLRLPVEAVRQRVLKESRSPQRDRRFAALVVLGTLPVPDRQTLLKRFLDDEDSHIRGVAHHLNRPFLAGEK